MTSEKTWFITGAGRGMGVDFAKAALAAGHNVVATAHNLDAFRDLSSSLALDEAQTAAAAS
jgi:NAD(P)-dependent dehydrogenase (short-subunit alcohol dehydrogenase family)